MLAPIVQTGLDVLQREGFAPLHGLRVGLVANSASVNARLRHAADLLFAAKHLRLSALFGPEHGFGAEAQDLIGVADSVHPRYRCPIHSLYGDSIESLRPTPESLRGLDALLIDLPDIGSRYYTFQATMLYCLEAAAQSDLPVVILDRPNPLGGLAIEGPDIASGYESFVGRHSIPIRHGMTMGELAQLYRVERNIKVALHVVRCEGWSRSHYFDETFLPWVTPSPNMPSLDTALVYPGQCLLEGTNLSEGRGTTRPFEFFGAPWIDGHELVDQLTAQNLPGAVFRPTQFRPTFQKFAGIVCGGAQVHISNRNSFRPVRTSLAILSTIRKMYAEHFRWRTEPYEFVSHLPAIDLLFGNGRDRKAISAGMTIDQIVQHWSENERAFQARREQFLLYR